MSFTPSTALCKAATGACSFLLAPLCPSREVALVPWMNRSLDSLWELECCPSGTCVLTVCWLDGRKILHCPIPTSFELNAWVSFPFFALNVVNAELIPAFGELLDCLGLWQRCLLPCLPRSLRLNSDPFVPQDYNTCNIQNLVCGKINPKMIV